MWEEVMENTSLINYTIALQRKRRQAGHFPKKTSSYKKGVRNGGN